MIVRAVVILLAVAAAIAPLPAGAIEAWYSTGFYPRLQSALTPAANRVPIALLDVASLVLLAWLATLFIRRARRRGAWRALGRTALSALVAAAVVYLSFLALWGLNYRRVPLEQKLAYDRSRVNRESGIAFANGAIASVNRGFAAAHATETDVAALEPPFDAALRMLGAARPAVIGIPKRSLLSLYFRRAAIDGMTDPFFLEIIVNPDVLAIERPFVIAHEWAHLAGYADESEANFVAWLTCIHGDAAAQYSGWMAAFEHASAALGRDDRRALAALDPGPRDDLRAMAARYSESSPVVRQAARDVYDRYLKANRVAEGIASYDAVVRLMLGTSFDTEWSPRLRNGG